MKSSLLTLTILACLLGSLINRSAQAAELDAFGGFSDIKGEQTGFFHAEKIDGRWWLVTPEGNAFWGIGMAHPVTDFMRGAITFAYGGDQEAWLRGTIQRMRDLGYNCVWSGPYCPERMREGYVDRELAERVFAESEIPYAFPLPLIKHNVELKPGELQPDVFSDEYSQYVDELAAKYVPPLANSPWIMGYYYGFGSWDREIGWINTTISRMGSPGRERLLGVLEERYNGKIAPFNKIYGTRFGSFEELEQSGSIVYPEWIRILKMGNAQMPKKSGSQEMFDDAQVLLGEIIEQVYRLGHDAIRAHDKNHMIFGAYVKEATLNMDMWKRVDPYVDVIAPQHVSKVFPIGKVVDALDKPALISDQPFGNVYPLHLVQKGGTPGPVPEHVDRLVLYDILANRISRDPDYIGVDFCSCLFDQSHVHKAYDRGQPGFFSIDGEPREHLCRTVQNVNAQMLHNVQKDHDPKAVEDLDMKFHETLQRYRDVVKDRQAFLKRNPSIEYP
ncbi:MAG: hypothetical protein CBD18_07395 [Opitutales bacterium TMED158]|nr:MAG: hypothetical protein CBD18_07395 [Opitutales bacterium TMED158]